MNPVRLPEVRWGWRGCLSVLRWLGLLYRAPTKFVATLSPLSMWGQLCWASWCALHLFLLIVVIRVACRVAIGLRYSEDAISGVVCAFRDATTMSILCVLFGATVASAFLVAFAASARALRHVLLRAVADGLPLAVVAGAAFTVAFSLLPSPPPVSAFWIGSGLMIPFGIALGVILLAGSAILRRLPADAPNWILLGIPAGVALGTGLAILFHSLLAVALGLAFGAASAYARFPPDWGEKRSPTAIANVRPFSIILGLPLGIAVTVVNSPDNELWEAALMGLSAATGATILFQFGRSHLI